MVERPYAGQLAHQRKAARRQALIAAGLQLLGTEGAHATTVLAVCRRTGMSSRYFYESFAAIDELLVAVFDDIMQDMVSRAVEVAAFLVMGGLLESILAWTDGALDIPRDLLIDRFTDLATSTMERALQISAP